MVIETLQGAHHFPAVKGYPLPAMDPTVCTLLAGATGDTHRTAPSAVQSIRCITGLGCHQSLPAGIVNELEHLRTFISTSDDHDVSNVQPQHLAAGGGGAAAGERQAGRPAPRPAARQAPARRLRPGRGGGTASAAGQEAA